MDAASFLPSIAHPEGHFYPAMETEGESVCVWVGIHSIHFYPGERRTKVYGLSNPCFTYFVIKIFPLHTVQLTNLSIAYLL